MTEKNSSGVKYYNPNKEKSAEIHGHDNDNHKLQLNESNLQI